MFEMLIKQEQTDKYQIELWKTVLENYEHFLNCYDNVGDVVIGGNVYYEEFYYFFSDSIGVLEEWISDTEFQTRFENLDDRERDMVREWIYDFDSGANDGLGDHIEDALNANNVFYLIKVGWLKEKIKVANEPFEEAW